MLINKKQVEGLPIAVNIKYNEKTITVEPGEVLDVRNFDVPQANVLAVEAHVMKKNPGAFKQDASPLVAATSKEAESQIQALTNNINDVNAQNSNLIKENAKLRDEINSLKNEQNGFEILIKDLKSDVRDLKAKIKNLNHPDTK